MTRGFRQDSVRTEGAQVPAWAGSASRSNCKQAAVWLLVLLGMLSAATGVLVGRVDGGNTPAAAVDPLIGTGHGPGGPVNLYPGATRPFGMVQQLKIKRKRVKPR